MSRPKYPYEVKTFLINGQIFCAPFKTKREAIHRAEMKLRADYSDCDEKHWRKVCPNEFPNLDQIARVEIVETFDDCFPHPCKTIFSKVPPANELSRLEKANSALFNAGKFIEAAPIYAVIIHKINGQRRPI